MRIAALAFLLTAAPTLAVAMDDSDRFALQIESGRLGVMMDQSERLLPLIKAPQPAATPDTPAQSRAWIYENLVSSVLRYNLIAHQACHDGIVGGEFCGGPFLPAWLKGKPTDYSDTQLRAMTDEAAGRLMPFWSALCAKAPEAEDDTLVCSIE